MKLNTGALAALAAVLLVTLVDAAPKQQFKAVQFLTMLNTTFGEQALHDLLSVLESTLQLPPRDAAQAGAAAAPLQGTTPSMGPTPDMGTTGPTMVPTAPPTTAAPTKPPSTKAPPPSGCNDHRFIQGTTITYFSEARALGTRALIQCDTGYVGKLTQIQCRPPMNKPEWESIQGWAGCKPVDCGRSPPTVGNARPLFQETTFGSLVSYECLNGFSTAEAAPNATCGVDPNNPTAGRWSTPTFACNIRPKSSSFGGNNNMDLAKIAAMLQGAGTGAQAINNANPANQLMAQLMAQMGKGGANTGMQQPQPTQPTQIDFASMMGMAGQQNPVNSNANNNANPILKMLQEMINKQAPTTTPRPVQPRGPGGLQLPQHLFKLLPGKMTQKMASGAMKPAISQRNMNTLKSMGIGATNPNMPGIGGANMASVMSAMRSNPSALFGGAGPASMGMGMGMGGGMGGGFGMPGAGGKGGAGAMAMDPEARQERQESMMMMHMMNKMMQPQANNNAQGGEAAIKNGGQQQQQQQQQQPNPLAGMFPGMSMGGGMMANPMAAMMGGGKGMDPMQMFMMQQMMGGENKGGGGMGGMGAGGMGGMNMMRMMQNPMMGMFA